VTSLGTDAFQEAFRIQNELLQVMLRGGGIATMVERLSELLTNPVAVADPLFHFIAGAPDAEHGDRHRRETMLRGGTAREVLDDPVAGAQFRRVAAEGRPVLFPPFPEHGMDERRLMAPILAGTELLGYLTIAEETTPIQELHNVVLQQAALILALELLKQRAVLEGEMRLRSDFLRDCSTRRAPRPRCRRACWASICSDHGTCWSPSLTIYRASSAAWVARRCSRPCTARPGAVRRAVS